MTLRRDTVSFFDGNGLMCPESHVGSPYKRGSDNGVLHTSRYLILQRLKGEELDAEALSDMIKCIDPQGYLHRAPGDNTEDTPDDHYGILSILNILDMSRPYVRLPWRCCHPMLIYMRALQVGGVQGFIARLFSLPMAILIAFSNLNKGPEISDKILTWNVIQGTKKSLLCRLGSLLWYARNDIYKIADTYYPNNPMGKQWVK